MRILMILLMLFINSSVFAASGSMQVSVLPAPPFLSFDVEFTESSGNKALDAEESGKIILKVTNSGKGDAFNVVAKLNPEKQFNGLMIPSSVNLDTIPAGQTVTKEIPITTTDTLESGLYKLSVSLKEGNGFNPAPSGIAFTTKKFKAPKLIVADMSFLDTSRNGMIEPMENTEVKVRIQNTGEGGAFDVKANVVLGNNVFLGGDRKSSFSFPSIPSGQYKDISFIIYTNSMIADGHKIPVSIAFTDKKNTKGTHAPVNLAMHNPDSQSNFKTVQAVVEKPAPIAIASGLSVGVDTKIPAGMTKAGRYDVAVVIGNSKYSNAPDVDYALNDARVLKQYLIKTFGFDKGNIIYVENATLANFNQIFGNMQSPRGKLSNYIKTNVSNVFIYYVGHGAPDLDTTEAYFVPVDADPHYLASSGYKLQTFYNNIDKMNAKKLTVVIDACFSGDSASGMLFKNISPALVKVKKQYTKPHTATLMTSSGFSEVSSWYPEMHHSMFTYWFLKGIQGEADLDNNKQITVAEMKKYLADNVTYEARKLNGIEQNPVIDGKFDDVLVVLK